MSALNARCALLAANTASSAGTVAVGSAIGISAVFRRLVVLAFDRVEAMRARAVAPAALAAAVRVPDRRRRAVVDSVAVAPLPVVRPLAPPPAALPLP
jgi:hypothetical protein